MSPSIIYLPLNISPKLPRLEYRYFYLEEGPAFLILYANQYAGQRIHVFFPLSFLPFLFRWFLDLNQGWFLFSPTVSANTCEGVITFC